MAQLQWLEHVYPEVI